MECPICKEAMKKVGWNLTSNAKTGQDLKEYDYTTYQCAEDDVWVNTEIPASNSSNTSS